VYLTLSNTHGVFTNFVAILYCFDPLFDIPMTPRIVPRPAGTPPAPLRVVVVDMSNRSCYFDAHRTARRLPVLFPAIESPRTSSMRTTPATLAAPQSRSKVHTLHHLIAVPFTASRLPPFLRHYYASTTTQHFHHGYTPRSFAGCRSTGVMGWIEERFLM
jgi:hypothetical protein